MTLKKIIVLFLVVVTSHLSMSQTTYSDDEIGLNVQKLTQRLQAKGLDSHEISVVINQERSILTEMHGDYLQMLQDYNQSHPPPSNQNNSCSVPVSERQALIDLYNSTNGSGWINSTNWNTSEPVCNWHGVWVIDGHVHGLELDSNNLVGVFPESIDDLTEVTMIDMNANALSGPMPSSIANLTKLWRISLNHNDFLSIPNWFGDITSLEWLSIGSNDLQGNIPSTFTNHPNLRVVNLIDNTLGTEIPDFIWGIPNLEFLNLAENNYTDEISLSIGIAQSLKDLNLSGNNMTGEIPSSLGDVTTLRHLRLDVNNIEGNVPQSFQNLSNLTFLGLGLNKLNGDIPDMTSNAFINLGLSYNEFIFSDFETEHPEYLEITNTVNHFYSFAPQAKVDQIETITVTEGEPINLTTILNSSNNNYQWYKDGVPISTSPSNPHSISTSATFSDEGEYYFLATNSVVQGLTLERHPITIVVDFGNEGNPNDSCDCNSFAPLSNKKYVLSGWVKEDITNFTPVTPEDRLVLQPLSYENSSVKVMFSDINGTVIGSPLAFFPTGEIIDGWQRIVGEFLVPVDAVDISLDLESSNPDINPLNLEIVAYFDDIRIHPYNGNLKSFVYDKENYRLMAELDENNFATFYEYDSEGGLIRVKKETERGVMTIQETRSGNKIKTDF